MTPKQLATAQTKANALAKTGWIIENGELLFTGKGDNLCTDKQYGDFEMFVDWKLYPGRNLMREFIFVERLKFKYGIRPA